MIALLFLQPNLSPQKKFNNPEKNVNGFLKENSNPLFTDAGSKNMSNSHYNTKSIPKEVLKNTSFR